MGNGDVYTGMRSLMTLTKAQYQPSNTPVPLEGTKFYRFIKGQQCSTSSTPEHAGLLQYIAQQWHLQPNQCSNTDQTVEPVTMTDYDPSVVTWNGEIFGQSLERDDLFTASYPWLWCRSSESLNAGLDIVIGEKIIDASLAGDGSFTILFPSDSAPVPANVLFSRADSAPVATYVSQSLVLTTAPKGAPRIEYDPVSGDALGLLIEEARTNSLLNSASLDRWSISGSIAANNVVSPDGTSSAETLTGTATQSVLGAQGDWTFSAFIKLNSVTVSLNGISASFDPRAMKTTASDSSVKASITPSVKGWARLQITAASFVPTSVSISASGAAVWGAQLEQGSFATSYIATTTAPVFRAADAVSTTGTKTFANGVGSMEIRFLPLSGPANGSIFHIPGSRSLRGDAVAGQFSMNLHDSKGSVIATATLGSVAGYPDLRIAFTISSNTLTGAISGALRAESAPFAGIQQGSSILFGRDENGAQLASGHLRKIIYWDRALSEGTMVAESGDPSAPLPLQGQITIGEFANMQYMRNNVFNFQVVKKPGTLTFFTPDYDMTLQISPMGTSYSGAIDVVVDNVRHQVPLTCVLEKANIR